MIKRSCEKISALIKKYRHQYILVDVHDEDQATNTPVSGKLLARSRNRNEIYKKLHLLKNWSRPIFICYTDSTLPQGTEAALSIL